jgi:hypothetical protein
VAARHAAFPAPAVARSGLVAFNSKAIANSAPISLNAISFAFARENGELPNTRKRCYLRRSAAIRDDLQHAVKFAPRAYKCIFWRQIDICIKAKHANGLLKCIGGMASGNR